MLVMLTATVTITRPTQRTDAVGRAAQDLQSASCGTHGARIVRLHYGDSLYLTSLYVGGLQMLHDPSLLPDYHSSWAVLPEVPG